jgi:drug/metabolite transporter (DMT)-like permease
VHNHKFHGIVLFLLATFLFALHDATSKYLLAFFAISLIVWARYLVLLVLILIGVAPGQRRALFVSRRPRLMVLRALALTGVSLLFQGALKLMPLAETTAVFFVTPLFVALLAGPLLGEKVRLASWLATLAGFAGVLLIARPGGGVPGLGVAYALAGAACNAAYQILTRKLSTSEPALRQLFYTALVGTLATSFAVPSAWNGELPTLVQTLLIVSLAIAVGVGHFLLIRAFDETPASTLSPLLYVQLIWAALLGFLLFGDLPEAPTTIGMLIIGAASLSQALRRPRAPN